MQDDMCIIGVASLLPYAFALTIYAIYTITSPIFNYRINGPMTGNQC